MWLFSTVVNMFVNTVTKGQRSSIPFTIKKYWARNLARGRELYYLQLVFSDPQPAFHAKFRYHPPPPSSLSQSMLKLE